MAAPMPDESRSVGPPMCRLPIKEEHPGTELPPTSLWSLSGYDGSIQSHLTKDVTSV